MAEGFIPAQDSAALAWMQVFAGGITANPSLYLLTAVDATAITAAVDLFATALAVVQDPAQNTVVTVAAKDDARTSAEQICRLYAALIKPNAGISDPDKLAIGVPPVNNDRTPINVPSTSPLLNVIASTPGSQTLRYSDTFTPDSGAKPFGADTLQLFVGVEAADVIVTNPEDADFYGAFTKNPIGVAFVAADNGKQATYYARWAGKNGEVGPWSAPATLAIAA